MKGRLREAFSHREEKCQTQLEAGLQALERLKLDSKKRDEHPSRLERMEPDQQKGPDQPIRKEAGGLQMPEKLKMDSQRMVESEMTRLAAADPQGPERLELGDMQGKEQLTNVASGLQALERLPVDSLGEEKETHSQFEASLRALEQLDLDSLRETEIVDEDASASSAVSTRIGEKSSL